MGNSGKAWGQPIDDYDVTKGFTEIMNLNVTSPFHLTKLCVPMLEAVGELGRPACVINIGSIDGLRTPAVGVNTYSYSTSKMALIALTRHLARDLAPRNINVNLIAPGPFFTKMLAGNYQPALKHWNEPDHPEVKKFKHVVAKSNPSGRLGETNDAAGTAIFLMSRRAATSTGPPSTLTVAYGSA